MNPITSKPPLRASKEYLPKHNKALKLKRIHTETSRGLRPMLLLRYIVNDQFQQPFNVSWKTATAHRSLQKFSFQQLPHMLSLLWNWFSFMKMFVNYANYNLHRRENKFSAQINTILLSTRAYKRRWRGFLCVVAQGEIRWNLFRITFELLICLFAIFTHALSYQYNCDVWYEHVQF